MSSLESEKEKLILIILFPFHCFIVAINNKVQHIYILNERFYSIWIAIVQIHQMKIINYFGLIILFQLVILIIQMQQILMHLMANVHVHYYG